MAQQAATIDGSITFMGLVAQGTTLQAQNIGGNITLLLPNTKPTTGQALTGTALLGNFVRLDWSDTIGSVSPASGVSSFNGRAGTVVPLADDYAAFYVQLQGSVAFTGMASFASGTTIDGFVEIRGGLLDQGNNSGIAGQLLGSTGSGVMWMNSTSNLQGTTGDPPTGNNGADNHVATGSNGVLLGVSSTYSIVVGAVSSGDFQADETITQAISGATATLYGLTVVGGLIVTTASITGTPDSSDIWTGNTSAATFTPTAIPVVGDSNTIGTTITLSGNAAYSDASMYSVQALIIGPPGVNAGILGATPISGTQFTVFSSNTDDTSTFFWACFGKNESD